MVRPTAPLIGDYLPLQIAPSPLKLCLPPSPLAQVAALLLPLLEAQLPTTPYSPSPARAPPGFLAATCRGRPQPAGQMLCQDPASLHPLPRLTITPNQSLAKGTLPFLSFENNLFDSLFQSPAPSLAVKTPVQPAH